MKLISLQLKSTPSFENNLKQLITTIDKCSESSFILAPELYLTNYHYENMDEASHFAPIAIASLTKLSLNHTIALTILIKENDNFYNRFFCFHKGSVIYTQDKAKLFPLNQEHDFFSAGDTKKITKFNVNGITYGVLICFELRFISLWEQLKGVDIILIPAMWGKTRKSHFESLTKALAIINQCYVVASNSANADMARSSSISSPFGVTTKNDRASKIEVVFEPKEIVAMRRYIKVEDNLIPTL